MTTVITRIYEKNETADKVVAKLQEFGFTDDFVDVIAGGADAGAQMSAAKVSDAAAEKYAPLVAKGHPLVVVRAPFTPFGSARKAIEIVDSEPSVDAGLDKQDILVGLKRDTPPGIIPGHPRFLTPRDMQLRSEPVTAALGFNMVTARRARHSVMSPPRTITGEFMTLLSTKERKPSVMENPKRITGGMIALLSTKERQPSVSRKSGPIFSDFFGLRTLSGR